MTAAEQAWLTVTKFLLAHRQIIGVNITTMIPFFLAMRQQGGLTCERCSHRAGEACAKLRVTCDEVGHYCGALVPTTGTSLAGGGDR